MMLTGAPMPEKAMRQQISSAINIIIHVARQQDGTRRLTKISEVAGMEGDVVMMQDLYEFIRTGTTSTGKIVGTFRPTGIRSTYATQLEQAGYRNERAANEF
jgi:pilus assembly protein CpaF